MDHTHTIQKLPRLARAAAQLQHGVGDGHYLAENNFVHTAHGLFAFFFVHVVPRPVIRDGLKLCDKEKGETKNGKKTDKIRRNMLFLQSQSKIRSIETVVLYWI